MFEIPREYRQRVFRSPKRITLSDLKSPAYLQVELDGYLAAQIRVDGNLPIEGKKCDWALEMLKEKHGRTKKEESRTPKIYLLVELKGQKFSDALEQLQATMQWLRDNIDSCTFHSVHTVLTRQSPKIHTKVINAQALLKKQNILLYPHSPGEVFIVK